MIGRYENPYVSVDFRGDLPAGSRLETHLLPTADRAAGHGFLYSPRGKRPKTVVTFMHPRANFARHYAVPGLLERGYAVWTQNSRWLGNDTHLVHERVLLDVAAGMSRLRDLGFERIVACGNSGGGSLYTFYAAQAHAAAGHRLTETPAGERIDLNAIEMPRIDGLVYLAAHPGEGEFLMRAIDPSILDEGDPLSCNPALDLYNSANGFRPPPEPSRYTRAFLDRYREAQLDRVRRLDLRARELVGRRDTARRRARADHEDWRSLRESIATPLLLVYRTDADPRAVDLSIDPSDRDYGSLFARRPDVFNWGPFGFARTLTPEAWLSTWSGVSSRAEIRRNAPVLDVPALLVSYTGDNAIFPADAQMIFESLGTSEKERVEVRGDHYGFPLAEGEPAGRDLAIPAIADWLARGFPAT